MSMTVERAFDSLAGIVEMWGFGHHAEALATLRAELAGLRADAEKNIASRIQEVINNLDVPKLSPSKAEYWKAGVRSVVMAVNEALDDARQNEVLDAARQQESSNGQ